MFASYRRGWGRRLTLTFTISLLNIKVIYGSIVRASGRGRGNNHNFHITITALGIIYGNFHF